MQARKVLLPRRKLLIISASMMKRIRKKRASRQ
jgi:hypothetical protein